MYTVITALQYRGAAPINWAIINGEPFTGVTTFKLKHEIDTGNIPLSKKIEIREDETAGELMTKWKKPARTCYFKHWKNWLRANSVEKPSETMPSGNELRYAPKIFTETCRINWNKPLNEIYNLVRGFIAHPAAFTELDGKTENIRS